MRGYWNCHGLTPGADPTTRILIGTPTIPQFTIHSIHPILETLDRRTPCQCEDIDTVGCLAMGSWTPITEAEFSGLLDRQYDALSEGERKLFDRYRVRPWKAVIRRSEQAGDEHVFVVAQAVGGVLYFDDVEYGFNISGVDDSGRIITPGGSQSTLKDAVGAWFRESKCRTQAV